MALMPKPSTGKMALLPFERQQTLQGCVQRGSLAASWLPEKAWARENQNWFHRQNWEGPPGTRRWGQERQKTLIDWSWPNKRYPREIFISLCDHRGIFSLLFRPLEGRIGSLFLTAITWHNCRRDSNQTQSVPVHTFFAFAGGVCFFGADMIIPIQYVSSTCDCLKWAEGKPSTALLWRALRRDLFHIIGKLITSSAPKNVCIRAVNTHCIALKAWRTMGKSMYIMKASAKAGTSTADCDALP